MTSNRQRDPGRDSRTFVALFGLLLIAGFLMALAAMVVPQILGLVIIVGGFVGMIALHYLLWGRWMSQLLPQEDEPASPPVSSSDA